MNFTEIRLKLRHFFRKNGRIIVIIFLIWFVIFLINLMIGRIPKDRTPSTTYEPHVSVIDSTKSTPKSLQNPIENMINEYVLACNDGNYQKAFDMLSDDCKKYSFNNNVENFMVHVLVKMPMPKKHVIQDYSKTTYNKKDIYIYEVKYFDDLLATGLTNSTYAFTSEKMAFYEDGKNNLLMNVGNFLYYEDVKKISENEYLKIDVLDKVVEYETETYTVRFTNRSNYTVVIADGAESDEVNLVLQTDERRKRVELTDIVLAPNANQEIVMSFPKFSDDGDYAKSIDFSQIRVMEVYSGTEDVDDETIKDEINNAISKFSMGVQIAK